MSATRLSNALAFSEINFISMSVQWYAYILQCSDGSYYVDHTEDVAARLVLHNVGRGAFYTAHRRPVTLVYTELFPSKPQAITREKQLKKWSRAKKEALIEGDRDRLRRLAKRMS